jgi:Gene product 88
MATITINHATRAPSPALAFWQEDTAVTYSLPLSADVAHLIAGSMGFPSKMPGTAYGLSARRCITGSKLVALLGTVCSGCYALKGNYVYSDVIRAQEIRYAGTKHARWSECMAFLLNAMHGMTPRPKRLRTKKVKSKGWHRWHDAGDLQSVPHLAAICRVCELTPRIKHWLPTREVAILLAYVKSGGRIPDNLLVRVSATKVDGQATKTWLWTSGVHDQIAPAAKDRCTAPDTNGECGPCRKCWDREQSHTTYHLH